MVTGLCGSTPVGKSDAFTVSPAVTTTYYVKYNGSCSTTSCATVSVTINTISTAITGGTALTPICAGISTTQTVEGGSNATGAVTEWFTRSCGRTAEGTGDAITGLGRLQQLIMNAIMESEVLSPVQQLRQRRY